MRAPTAVYRIRFEIALACALLCLSALLAAAAYAYASPAAASALASPPFARTDPVFAWPGQAKTGSVRYPDGFALLTGNGNGRAARTGLPGRYR
jgi:hypothetical protein